MARDWLERIRVAGAVACFAGAGGIGAWVIAQPTDAYAARNAARPIEVTVGDSPLAKGADAHAFVEELADRWEAEPLTLEVPGEPSLTRSRRALGARVDRGALESLVRQAGESTSAMRRRAGTVAAEDLLRVPVPFVLDEAATFERLADLKDRFDRRPSDARLDARSGEVRPHTDGRTLDVHGTLDALHDGLARGATTVAAAVEERPAGRAAEDLAGIDVSAVLGVYETRYSLSAEARDRTFNLRVAAEKLDGLVVMPGEVFDFNEAVGERSEANGFRPAPQIAGGELVDGVGGGTCQIAGTLHSAVFFAGLPIEERGPHSRPSTYIYMGLDAVVSYPQLNFRFRNDLDFPVAIGFTIDGGVARAELRGRPVHRLVSFVRRVDDTTPYTEREIEDASLPRGVRVLSQRGVPGFKVTSFRIVRDTVTNQAVRTRVEDTYPPTQQIWRVGAGGLPADDFVPPEGDGHPEYTADGYLEVVQGEGVRGTQTIRRAGRTGTPGWTARLGYPQPDPARFD